jgi:hypothetical protein
MMMGRGNRKNSVKKPVPDFSLQDKFKSTPQRLKLKFRDKKLTSTAYERIRTIK